jgi:hypothetical protein
MFSLIFFLLFVPEDPCIGSWCCTCKIVNYFSAGSKRNPTDNKEGIRYSFHMNWLLIIIWHSVSSIPNLGVFLLNCISGGTLIVLQNS